MQAIELNSFDLLSVSGSDAKKFLQGQVTCDMNQLTPAHSLIGALCNLKGRVIGSFRMVEYNDVCYLLLPPGMGAIVKTVLNKYIVFFKAQCLGADNLVSRTGLIGDPDSILGTLGFSAAPGEDNAVVIAGHSLLVKIPGALPRYELWNFAQSPSDRASRPAALTTTGSTTAWDLADIQAGIIQVTPELSEQQLPEALNYDLSGVINFKKGCYTGQEIVARMYYRGTAKKRLFYGSVHDCGIRPTAIYCRLAAAEEAIEGELLRAVPDASGNWHLLAILPVNAIEPANEVFLDLDKHYPVQLHSLS